jgi:hypothetical protein
MIQLLPEFSEIFLEKEPAFRAHDTLQVVNEGFMEHLERGQLLDGE